MLALNIVMAVAVVAVIVALISYAIRIERKLHGTRGLKQAPHERRARAWRASRAKAEAARGGSGTASQSRH